MQLRSSHRIIQRRLFSATLFLLVWGVPAALAESHPLISAQAYGRLLDRVFPHRDPDVSKVLYEMVLRFMMTNHTESEVVIDVYQDGKAEAWLFSVVGPSVWHTAKEYIQKAGKEDVERIAKLVRSSKREVALPPAQVWAWHAACFESLRQASTKIEQQAAAERKTGEVELPLDGGGTFELWFTQDLTSIHWRVMDEEVNDSGPAGISPVARWMNDVRSYAIKNAGAATPPVPGPR